MKIVNKINKINKINVDTYDTLYVKIMKKKEIYPRRSIQISEIKRRKL